MVRLNLENNLKRYIPLLFLVILSTTLFGQNNSVRLIYSDELTGSVINGEPIRKATGSVHIIRDNVNLFCSEMTEYIHQRMIIAERNVRIVQKGVTLTADYARYFPDIQYLEVSGNVQVKSDSLHLKSKYGNYFMNEELIKVWGNPVLFSDDGTTITSDTIYHHRKLSHSKLVDHVNIHSSKDHSIIKGKYAEYFSTDKYFYVINDSEFIQYPEDATTGDTLFINSHKIESFQKDSSYVIASGEVKIIQAELYAIADSTIWLRNKGLIRLRKSPIIWYSNYQISGEKVDVHIRQNELRRLMCYQQSFAISDYDISQKKYNQLKGQTIQYDFRQRKIHTITIYQTAEALYFLEEDKKPNGANLISGDKISISFVDNEVNNIKVYGGVEGKLIPETEMIKEPIFLKGFFWDFHKRPTRETRPVYVK